LQVKPRDLELAIGVFSLGFLSLSRYILLLEMNVSKTSADPCVRVEDHISVFLVTVLFEVILQVLTFDRRAEVVNVDFALSRLVAIDLIIVPAIGDFAFHVSIVDDLRTA